MYKLAMVADLHHFSETLSDGGKAYHLRESSDQKCLMESGAIIDSAFETIGNSDCDAVLIAGDLSNDGEKVSHEEMKAKIDKLAEKKPVFVVYATHDWCCDGNAKRFEGDKYYNDVETVSPPWLREFYKDYGYGKAYDEYITHLGASSYAVKLSDKVRLLGLNDDQDGKGHSGYSDEHLEWILKHVKDAKANGETVVVMQHHLILPGLSMLINKGQIIGEHEERAEALASAGVDFVIVGHSHNQRTTEYTAKNGNKMYQINLGALCGHPAPITTLSIDDSEYKVDVSYLEKFTYKGVEYTNQYITDHTKGLLLGILKSGAENDKEEFIDRVLAIGGGIKREDIEKGYKFLAKLCKFALNVTVGKAGRIINSLTFGKGINKAAIKQIKDDNLMEHIMNIYLSVFDGSINAYGADHPVYTIVKDVIALPGKIGKTLRIKALQKDSFKKVIDQVGELAEELVNPSLPDNHHFVIERK